MQYRQAPWATLPANLARKLLASRPSLFCTWRTLEGHIRMCRTVCRTLRSSCYKYWTEGSMALKRWIVYLLTGTIIESQWQLLTSPQPVMLQKVIFTGHSMQHTCKSMPGRLFTEPTRLWVYHGKRMSRLKKCHRNLPDEVSLKCNCVKCATRCCPCRDRNVRCCIFHKCQAKQSVQPMQKP